VTFVTVSKVRGDIGWRANRCGKQGAIGVLVVDYLAHFRHEKVILWRRGVARPLAFDEIGNPIELQPVHAGIEPIAHGLYYGATYPRVIDVYRAAVGDRANKELRDHVHAALMCVAKQTPEGAHIRGAFWRIARSAAVCARRRLEKGG
jgi:hypothetical protein